MIPLTRGQEKMIWSPHSYTEDDCGIINDGKSHWILFSTHSGVFNQVFPKRCK